MAMKNHKLVLYLIISLILIGTTVVYSQTNNHPGTWELTGDLVQGRRNHTATLLNTGKVLVVSGHGGTDGGYLSSAEIYDPSTGTWSVTGNVNIPRDLHRAVKLDNGKVMIIGGRSMANHNYLNSVEIYDPITGEFSLHTSMNIPRGDPEVVLLQDGSVLVVGGKDEQYTWSKTAEIYNSTSQTWTLTGDMSEGRQLHRLVLLENGQALVMGGYNGNVVVSSAELYDPISMTWTPTADMNTTRSGHESTILTNGRVLVAGGQRVMGQVTYQTSAEIYDPGTGQWSYTGSMSTPHQTFTMTLLPDGNVLVAGGITTWPPGSTTVTEVYEPLTGSWSSAGNLHHARHRHTATVLPDSSVLIAGGAIDDDYYVENTAELYIWRQPTTISHIEVIQATQDDNNNVPLISGKNTLVRVYLRNQDQVEETGTLNVSTASGVIFEPGNTNGIVTVEDVEWVSQRWNLTKTLNYLIPGDYLSGEVTFIANVGGKTDSITQQFIETDPIKIIFVPIEYSGKVGEWENVDDAINLGKWIFPTPDIVVDRDFTPIKWDKCIENSSSSCTGTSEVKIESNISQLLEKLEKYGKAIKKPDYYVAGFLPDGNYLASGYSNTNNGHTSLIWKVTSPFSFTHELGHLLGREHSNTIDNLTYSSSCVKRNTTKDDDYTGTQEEWEAYVEPSSDWVNHPGLPDPPPYSSSLIQEVGINLSQYPSSISIKRKEQFFDYMSYCSYNWTSDWNYKQLINELSISSNRVLYGDQEMPISPSEYLLISGIVNDDGTGTLDSIWLLEMDSLGITITPGSDYCVEVLDTLDQILHNYCFDLDFYNNSTTSSTSVDSFSILLPYSTDINSVVLKKGVQVLDERTKSQNNPQVTLIYPNGGENWSTVDNYSIEWDAEDLDGDELVFNVYYSVDEVNWSIIGQDLIDNTLVVNSMDLPGTDNAKIKVVASDGVNNSYDESDDIFSVFKKEPTGSIITPINGIVFPPNTPIWLHGMAYDMEDGNLTDTGITWSSDIDGVIGYGQELSAGLSPGMHIISMTMTDSHGNEKSENVQVFIGYQIYLPFTQK